MMYLEDVRSEIEVTINSSGIYRVPEYTPAFALHLDIFTEPIKFFGHGRKHIGQADWKKVSATAWWASYDIANGIGPP